MSNFAASAERERVFLMHKKCLDFDTAYVLFSPEFLNVR